MYQYAVLPNCVIVEFRDCQVADMDMLGEVLFEAINSNDIASGGVDYVSCSEVVGVDPTTWKNGALIFNGRKGSRHWAFCDVAPFDDPSISNRPQCA